MTEVVYYITVFIRRVLIANTVRICNVEIVVKMETVKATLLPLTIELSPLDHDVVSGHVTVFTVLSAVIFFFANERMNV